ncbi:MAG: sulfatase/phosphatase domain-containing protein [Lentimonas sp.]
MLYDLKKDPDEFTNLINDPEYAQIKRSLSKQLNATLSKQ